MLHAALKVQAIMDQLQPLVPAILLPFIPIDSFKIYKLCPLLMWLRQYPSILSVQQFIDPIESMPAVGEKGLILFDGLNTLEPGESSSVVSDVDQSRTAFEHQVHSGATIDDRWALRSPNATDPSLFHSVAIPIDKGGTDLPTLNFGVYDFLLKPVGTNLSRSPPLKGALADYGTGLGGFPVPPSCYNVATPSEPWTGQVDEAFFLDQ